MKTDFLKQNIDKLSPAQRIELDDYLLGRIVNDSSRQSQEYELDMASDYLEEAAQLRGQWGKMQGLSSGYATLDDLTKGFVPGEVTIVGGATSNGKTTLCVNIAARVATANKNVLFVTLEMTKPQLTSRLLYAHNSFSDYSANVVYQKVDELRWGSVDGLIATAVKKAGVSLVVIDHLHYFTRELENVAEDLGRITKEFKKNAIRHQVPIILISHTRKGEGNTIDDLRGSSYIAQDADIVLMVTRKKDFPDNLTVTCEKNRNRGYDFRNNSRIFNFYDTLITEG